MKALTDKFLQSKLGQQIVKFGAAGFFCFFIEWLLLVISKEVFHLPILVGNTIAFTVSAIINYILSVRYIFETDQEKSRLREFVIFFVMAVGGGLINNVVLHYGTLLAEPVIGRYAYMLVKAFAAGVVMIYNFITRKLVLEKKEDPMAIEGAE